LLRKSGATTPEATRERVLHEIFLIGPDCRFARAYNGEVKVGGAWVLEETPRAIERRKGLEERIRKALAELPAPKSVDPTREESSYGFEWKATLQGNYWRVLSSADAFEALECVRVADATENTFEAVFGLGGEYVAGCKLLVTDDAAKYEGVLGRHLKVGSKEFEAVKSLGSTWLPGTRACLCRQAHKEWRVEICARQPFSVLLDQYFKISLRHGWVSEGVGLYLTHLLTGYRKTTYVRVTRYAEESKNKPQQRLWGELLPKTADWFAIAKGRIERGETPDWKLMLAKDVNQMEVNDLLFSYLLAAYLIEAHGDKMPAILTDVGKNKPSSDVLQSALGLPLVRLEARVYRWIRERSTSR